MKAHKATGRLQFRLVLSHFVLYNKVKMTLFEKFLRDTGRQFRSYKIGIIKIPLFSFVLKSSSRIASTFHSLNTHLKKTSEMSREMKA